MEQSTYDKILKLSEDGFNVIINELVNTIQLIDTATPRPTEEEETKGYGYSKLDGGPIIYKNHLYLHIPMDDADPDDQDVEDLRTMLLGMKRTHRIETVWMGFRTIIFKPEGETVQYYTIGNHSKPGTEGIISAPKETRIGEGVWKQLQDVKPEDYQPAKAEDIPFDFAKMQGLEISTKDRQAAFNAKVHLAEYPLMPSKCVCPIPHTNGTCTHCGKTGCDSCF